MKQTFNPEQVFFLLQSLLLKTSSFTTSFRQTLNLIKKEAMLEALETMLDRTLKEQ